MLDSVLISRTNPLRDNYLWALPQRALSDLKALASKTLVPVGRGLKPVPLANIQIGGKWMFIQP